MRFKSLKRCALPLLALPALGGCATRYGVTVWIDNPAPASLSCAAHELRTQGVTVSRDSATQAVVSEGGNVVTLSVTARQFEIAATSLHQPLSCAALRQAEPLVRKVIAVIEARCVAGGAASIAEVWNQEQCGTSFAGGLYPG